MFTVCTNVFASLYWKCTHTVVVLADAYDINNLFNLVLAAPGETVICITHHDTEVLDEACPGKALRTLKSVVFILLQSRMMKQDLKRWTFWHEVAEKESSWTVQKRKGSSSDDW